VVPQVSGRRPGTVGFGKDGGKPAGILILLA
jgi:hypothetical protein